MARIPGFHPGGSGSIPGMGIVKAVLKEFDLSNGISRIFKVRFNLKSDSL